MSNTNGNVVSSQDFAVADVQNLYRAMMAAWTLLVVILASVLVFSTEHMYVDLAHAQISAACDRDLLFRAWATKFGGVYAPHLEPNPWLHHPKRDITADNGDHLTLVNPAWMIRQVNEMMNNTPKHITARLTSSKLMSPSNAPDEWEKKALDLLESQKQTEVFETFDHVESGHEVARLARPLPTVEGCLSCHKEQGYKVGDVRGIISMEVETDALFAAKWQMLWIIYSVGSGIWLVGMFTLLFSKWKLQTAFQINRTAWDILKENETALQVQRDNLEKMTLALRDAAESAEEANKAKSQFLATMSHEIRTPLNGVIGISDLLMETPLQPKQIEYTQLIKASGESLLFLINDILDFSKIEAGKLELEQSEFIIYDLVESVIRILAPKAEEKGLDFIATFDSKVPGIIIGDANRLRQILVNLVSNAMKFTNSGGVRIHASVDALYEREIGLKFSVTDTGIGIPKERQDRLFKKFSQVDISTTRIYGGTGLGLEISKRLVELMNGNIHVESEEGKGTSFWFVAQFNCLPLVLKCMRADIHPCITEKRDFCRSHPPTRCARSGREVAYLQRVAELKGLKTLLVGTSKVLAPALKEQLQSWGMAVQTVNSPVEAMHCLVKESEQPFQLVVIDFAQHDSQSGELVRSIQNDDRLKSAALICLAPLADDLQQKPWKEPAKIRYVTKPICSPTLLDSIVRSFFALPDVKLSEPDIKTPGINKSLRILVAEDNQINRVVITEILKHFGLTCVVVENGALAVERIQNERFDVILMDCQMPVLDGYDAAEQIRQWEKEQSLPTRIPIIALTANATLEDVQRCFTAGMDAYCSKPINAPALFKEINRLLEAQRQ